MKIAGINRTSGSTASRSAARSSGAGSSFRPEGVEEGRAPTALAGAASLTAVDALLAIQENSSPSDAMTGRRRAVNRADEMLDILDEIKISLLVGGVPHGRLSRLLEVVEQQRGMVAEPGLADVLDDIELRARVELAKFGRVARG